MLQHEKGREGKVLQKPTQPGTPPKAVSIKLPQREESEAERVVAKLESALNSKNGYAIKAIERAADRLIDCLSQPAAIWAQTALIGSYIAVNTLAVFRVITFDPYPFLFLNLIFSLVSAYTTVFVLNSNRRQSAVMDAAERAELGIYRKILTDLERLERRLDNNAK